MFKKQDTTTLTCTNVALEVSLDDGMNAFSKVLTMSLTEFKEEVKETLRDGLDDATPCITKASHPRVGLTIIDEK